MNAETTSNPVARNIRSYILSACRTFEQTELSIYAYLCQRPDYRDGRCAPTLVDSIIDEMLDAGELHPSMVQCRETGRTYPTLRTI